MHPWNFISHFCFFLQQKILHVKTRRLCFPLNPTSERPDMTCYLLIFKIHLKCEIIFSLKSQVKKNRILTVTLYPPRQQWIVAVNRLWPNKIIILWPVKFNQASSTQKPGNSYLNCLLRCTVNSLEVTGLSNVTRLPAKRQLINTQCHFHFIHQSAWGHVSFLKWARLALEWDSFGAGAWHRVDPHEQMCWQRRWWTIREQKMADAINTALNG